MKDIKERLMNGEKSEDIMREFSASLARAKHEIEKERAMKEIEESKLSEARGAIVDSVMDYLKALGTIKETDNTTMAREMLYNILKESEEEIKVYGQMLDKFGSMPTPIVMERAAKPKTNSDMILRDFLKKSL